MPRRRQTVTIRHVAAEAGVSLQTVSRVINSAPNVRPATLERVRSAIEKLGYVPSIAAQRMSGSRSYFIMALNDRERTIADWTERQGSDWIDQMMLGGMLKCAELGYRIIVELVDTHSDQIERELTAAIAAVQPDGVILTPPHSQNPLILRILHEHRISIARIGSLSDGPGLRLVMDDTHAAEVATRHLLDLGHKRIGFISGSAEYELSAWRVDGWQSAMAAAGLPTAGLLANGDFSFDSGLEAASRLLDGPDPPTAIIASNDRMTLATLEIAQRRGLAVPRDLSLISFDDTPIVRFNAPAITAIKQPIADVVARAVELMIADLAGEAMPKSPVVEPADLVVRASTAGPRDA